MKVNKNILRDRSTLSYAGAKLNQSLGILWVEIAKACGFNKLGKSVWKVADRLKGSQNEK